MAFPRPCWPLVATAVCWGYNFVSIKLLYREMTPPALALVRFGLLWAVLVFACLASRTDLRMEAGDRLRAWLAGAVAMGFYMVLFLEGMAHTTPAEGAIVLATSPVAAYLLSVALRVERGSAWAFAGTLVAFGGVVLVVAGAHGAGHGSLSGNLVVFASALVWAGSVLQMRPLLTRYPPLPLLTNAMPGALPVLLAYGLADTLRVRPASWSIVTWLNLGQVVLLSGFVAFLGIYRGVQLVGPSAAMRYQLTVPVLAALFGWSVYGTRPLPVQWLGMGVVLGGVGLAAWARAKMPAPRDN